MMCAFFKWIQKTYRMVDRLEGSKVLHNVKSLSWLQLVTYLFPLIILPYLFRVIGPEKFGLICFAQAFGQYFMILTDYGFSVSATKEISLCLENKTKFPNIIKSLMTKKQILTYLVFLTL